MSGQGNNRIAVTGATGYVGGQVARRLAEAGQPHLVLVRDPARAPALPGVTVAVADYADGPAARAALAGVRTLFMVSGGEAVDRVEQHRRFIDAAVDAGVRHLIYLSFLAAAPDSIFVLGRDHWATEQYVRDSGLAFTFLRDNLYADFVPNMVGADGVIRGPGGDGRVSLVARDDVAEVATVVLRDPAAHRGASYDLTGPVPLSLAEAAEQVSASTGRPVRYQPETLAEAYQSRAGYGAPDWLVEAWVSTYTAIASGELAGVSPDIPRLTGHPATGLAEVLARQG